MPRMGTDRKNRETSEGLAGYPNIPSLAALRLCVRPSGNDDFLSHAKPPRRKGPEGFFLGHRGHGGGTEFTEWSPSALCVLGSALGDLCDEIQFCFRIRVIRGCRIRSARAAKQLDHGWHGWARIGKTEKRLKGWPVIPTFLPWRLCAFARVLPGINDHISHAKTPRRKGPEGFFLGHRGHGGGTEFTE
jgi:hypothetical protein